jgi:hypothetical protein
MFSYTSQSNTVFPDGAYRFLVDSAKGKHSKKNDPMIELQHSVTDGEETINVKDWLVFIPSCSRKIDQFRESIGEKVVPGEKVDVDPDDLIGKSGLLHLGVEEYEGQERNVVKRYLPPSEKPGVSEPMDIPF